MKTSPPFVPLSVKRRGGDFISPPFLRIFDIPPLLSKLKIPPKAGERGTEGEVRLRQEFTPNVYGVRTEVPTQLIQIYDMTKWFIPAPTLQNKTVAEGFSLPYI